jgi:flagellar assembly protein FliH
MGGTKTTFQSLEQRSRDAEWLSLAVEEGNPESIPEVRAFEFKNLSSGGLPIYEDVKSRFGSLAVTDAERSEKSLKDRKFQLHQHAKQSLCVQDEELRVLQERVSQEVQAISGAAKADGYRQGYEEGLQKGRDAAYAEIRQHGQVQLDQIQELLKGFESARTEVYKANEKILMQLMFRLSKMILLRELKYDRDYLGRLVGSLIEEASPKEYLVIRVNPQDLETIQLLEPQLRGSLQQLHHIKVESSLQVPVGGCQVETEWIHIESEIESQLRSIEKALWGGGDAI